MQANSKTYKGHNISIQHDDNPISPREDDNICIIHLAHRRYGFGDENYKDLESIQQANKKALRAGDICLPLYMYDHSGITIALTPFSCHFDSGQVGFVQVPRKIMIEEFGKKIFTPKLKKLALKIAGGEVGDLDTYIRGDIFGYIVDEDGDSCWGYYSIKEAMMEAENIIDYIVEEAKKSHFEQLKTWIKNKVPLHIRATMQTAIAV